MADDLEMTVMRRKAGAGRPAPELSGNSPAKVIRKVFSHAAENMGGLIASATSVAEMRVAIKDVVADLPEHPMLVRLNGADGRDGMVIIDAQICSAIVEFMTLGHVINGDTEPRSPTRTDALMVSDLVNRVLRALPSAMADLDDSPFIGSYAFGAVFEDTRAVIMSLADIPYRKFTVQLDLGEGAKAGEIWFVFPWYSAVQSKTKAAAPVDWPASLMTLSEDVTTSVEAILYRVSLPLSEIVRWQPGTVVSIPVPALANVSLEGSDGTQVAYAKLGQASGFRAVRITQDEDQARLLPNTGIEQLVVNESPVSPQANADGTLERGDLLEKAAVSQ